MDDVILFELARLGLTWTEFSQLPDYAARFLAGRFLRGDS